jgi:dCTP diphosphatase
MNHARHYARRRHQVAYQHLPIPKVSKLRATIRGCVPSPHNRPLGGRGVTGTGIPGCQYGSFVDFPTVVAKNLEAIHLRYHPLMMKDTPPSNLEELKQRIRKFAVERGWERYHTPKNLAMALIGEAGELVERFQWLSPEESAHLPPERHEQVRQEIADVLIYLTRLADLLDIDLLQAAADKIELNGQKYPVERTRGNVAKQDER